MRNVIIIYGILFIFLPALRAGTAPYYNPINNALIKAIIKVESSGNPKAISREGAWGLMQVRHAVWENELKKAGIIRHKQELFNPEKNILAGKYILTKYYGQTGCVEKTLQKYSGNEKRYFEKVVIAYWKQMKVDSWLSFCRHKPFDWEPGRLGIKTKRQADTPMIVVLTSWKNTAPSQGDRNVRWEWRPGDDLYRVGSLGASRSISHNERILLDLWLTGEN